MGLAHRLMLYSETTIREIFLFFLGRTKSLLVVG